MRYDEQTVERGLIALAYRNGSCTSASRFLAEDGLRIDRSTLREWRRRHPERYEQIRADVAPQIKARAVEGHQGLIDRLMEAERVLVERMVAEANEIPIRDVPGAQRNVATSVGIHTDKIADLCGEPNVRVSADLSGLLKELLSLGVEMVEPEEPQGEIGLADG